MLHEMPLGRAQVFIVTDDVTAAGAWSLEMAVARHLADGCREICVDVTDARLGPTLPGSLVRCHRRVLAAGGGLTVIAPPGEVRDALEGASYPIFSGRDSALTALG